MSRSVPITAAASVSALRCVLDDPDIRVLARRYSTWNQLADASALDLSALLQRPVQALNLPPAPPPAAVRWQDASWTDPLFPAALNGLDPAPALLSWTGALPARPGIAVLSGPYPSPQTLQTTCSAVASAAALGLAVIVDAGSGNASAAVSAAGESGASVVVVLPHGLDVPSASSALTAWLDPARDAVVSAVPAGRPATEAGRVLATRVACALAGSVLVCQMGLESGTGRDILLAALTSSRPLIAPEGTGPVDTAAWAMGALTGTHRPYGPLLHAAPPRHGRDPDTSMVDVLIGAGRTLESELALLAG